MDFSHSLVRQSMDFPGICDHVPELPQLLMRPGFHNEQLGIRRTLFRTTISERETACIICSPYHLFGEIRKRGRVVRIDLDRGLKIFLSGSKVPLLGCNYA